MSKHAQVVIVCVCGVVYVCMCAKWLWSIPVKNHLYLFVASHRATPKPISLMWSEKGYTSCCQHTTLLASVSKSYGRSNGFAAFRSWVVPPWETEKIYFITRNFWPETMHIWHVYKWKCILPYVLCMFIQTPTKNKKEAKCDVDFTHFVHINSRWGRRSVSLRVQYNILCPG